MITDYIEQKSGVLGGKAVIKGTRIGGGSYFGKNRRGRKY